LSGVSIQLTDWLKKIFVSVNLISLREESRLIFRCYV
jgi:hypothetical protein